MESEISVELGIKKGLAGTPEFFFEKNQGNKFPSSFARKWARRNARGLKNTEK